jgi:ubiquinol-cytochrome c reductase cytochrome b subunit
MNPRPTRQALASIFVDVSGVEVGTQLTVKWLGKPVFIRRRTEEEIEAGPRHRADRPARPERENANRRADASDANRTLDEAGEWLVMMGVCTHLGCVPLGDGAGDFGGWFCPCHGSHYDTAGRIRRARAARTCISRSPPSSTKPRSSSGKDQTHGRNSARPLRTQDRAARSGCTSACPSSACFYDTLMIPTPKNLNWMWIWGIVLTFCLALQIVTGIVLVMHYTPHVDLAFASVEHIMRNVNGGHMIRYLHQNGASLFFSRSTCTSSAASTTGYKAPREVTWIIGMLIYLLMMGTAFMGYVLPWGQMSFWGATVITGLFGAIPASAPDPDLAAGRPGGGQRHAEPLLLAALPAALRDRGAGRGAHLGLPHHRQQQPHRGRSAPHLEGRGRADTVPFWPYFVIKDLFALAVILAVFFAIVGFMPNYLGHPDNYIEANPLVTPAHIVPEWYFLPFYAILRAFTADVWVVIAVNWITFGIIDAKFFGVLAMFGAIAVMALAPWLDTSSVRSGRIARCSSGGSAAGRRLHRADVGRRHAGRGPYATISLIASAYWFAYFLVILPLLGVIEKPLPQPATIEEDFNAHYGRPPRAAKPVRPSEKGN